MAQSVPAPTLPKAIGDMLLELSVAVQRRAMYPGGHPSLESAEKRLMTRLAPVLAARSTLAVGVARDRLVIDGVTTDARQPVHRALAERLHTHRIAGLELHDGLSIDETAEFLSRLATDPDKVDRDKADNDSREWAHIRIVRQAYSRLAMRDDEFAGGGPTGLNRPAQLWFELAQAALLGGDTQCGPVSPESAPADMAHAINTIKAESSYDQAVIGYLLRIAAELKTADPVETAALRTQVSDLVTNLSQDALRRLLVMGGDLAQRRTFLMDATSGMAVDAVLNLAAAAATVSRRAISLPLMRLLTKLASHARQGTAPVRASADSAFRDHVRDMIAGWTLPDPSPGAYGQILDTMASPGANGPISSGITQTAEPERVVEICLELHSATDALWDAVTAIVARGQIHQLLDMLDAADPESPLPGLIRKRVATPEHFRQLLASPALDPARLQDFAKRVGKPAIVALLDALVDADSRAARRRLLDILAKLGDDIGPALVERLNPRAPWYVIRNFLILVGHLTDWPAGFSATPFAVHADPRVRREALRLMLRRHETRAAGILAAIADNDPALARLGLDAAVKHCPSNVCSRIVQRLQAESFAPELQGPAVQAIAASGQAAALDCLLGLASVRTRWLKRERVAPKSPVVLAALSALAVHWTSDPRAVALVGRAAHSSDRDIRAAAGHEGVAA
jgi:hypothetical protein